MRTSIALIGSLMLHATAMAAPPPRIASIEPARVPTGGGARVVIAGEGFMPGLTVRLCGTVLKDATWVTKNQVEFLSPARDAGSCDLAIENPDGQSARIRTVFAFSDAPLVPIARLPQTGITVLGAPLPAFPPGPDTGSMKPAPSAATSPTGTSEPGPDRVAAEFMRRLVSKEDTGPLHHARMRSPVSPGVVFDHAFSEAFPGVLVGTPIVHFEGRLESINLAGLRLWLPFVLHVTQERPARVTGFSSSVNPAGTREALVRTIEQHLGSDVAVDLSRPLRPLP